MSNRCPVIFCYVMALAVVRACWRVFSLANARSCSATTRTWCKYITVLSEIGKKQPQTNCCIGFNVNGKTKMHAVVSTVGVQLTLLIIYVALIYNCMVFHLNKPFVFFYIRVITRKVARYRTSSWPVQSNILRTPQCPCPLLMPAGSDVCHVLPLYRLPYINSLQCAVLYERTSFASAECTLTLT